MYCAKCETKVSIADSRCSKCNADLLAFGAMKSSLAQEGSRRPYAQAVKDIKSEVFREIGDEIEASKQEAPSDPFAAAILKPLYDNLLNILKGRYGSEAEINKAFDDQVVPAIDHFTGERDGRKFLQEIEDLIRSRLGDGLFRHYEDNGDEILKILRSGEIAVRWMDLLSQADLSVILFPFFKAVERACRVHTQERYGRLKDDSQIEAIDSWLPFKSEDLHIEDIPGWLAQRKSKIIEVVKGLLTENEFRTAGALATGVAIQLFGRSWLLKVRRTDRSEAKTFRIENLLEATGEESEKATLAYDLHKLQSLRNERVHGRVEENNETVILVRDLAYDCLKGLPAILRI